MGFSDVSAKGSSTTGNLSFDEFFGACNGSRHAGNDVKKTVVGLEQSGYSDSNSEVSVSKSVATTNLSVSGESENVGALWNSLPFIDFLGVGAS